MPRLNLSGFVELKSLGQGTYGCVYKARRESDGKTYAVKVVNLTTLKPREIQDAVNEIRLMASFQSPFIVRFYEAFCDDRRLCIVTEYSRLGDLAHLIERRKRKSKPLTEDVIWCYMLQMLEGLQSMHATGVVHRDLKSANILISAPDLIKIADLGISTVLHTRQLARTQIGTPLYIAPEVWKRRPYDQKCDMWSLGILLFEMMTFSYPFYGRTTAELVQRVCLGRFTVPNGRYSPDLVSILRKLLQVNPILRPSVTELMNSQAVRSRLKMLDVFRAADAQVDVMSGGLLATIKIPRNMKSVNLPNPAYGKHIGIVKPLEQRMHMKRGVPMRKDLPLVSSPELQMIADLDWWSPTRENQQCRDSAEKDVLLSEIEAEIRRPRSYRPVIPAQPEPAQLPPQRILPPRPPPLCAPPAANPRWRRAIR